MRAAYWMIPLLPILTACSEAETERMRPGPMQVEKEIPADAGTQIVHVVTRDFEPGAEVPWHTHPGFEIAYLESGEMELVMDGAEPRRLTAGESFTMERGTVHGGSNPGPGPARLVITYVVDKDAPLRTPAEAPDGQ